MTKFKRTKFRANSEAEKIQWQKERFAEGYEWAGGGKVIKHLDKPFFFSEENGLLYQSDSEDWFLSKDNEETFLTPADPIDQEIADKQSEIEALKKVKLANEKLEQAEALNEEARKLLEEAGLWHTKKL